ncbi:MAG: alpha/beta hydrolase [Planctomycetia bacterium]|nr:alpha/beta hydrolase [Planctomycetia bacterium]
MKTNVCRMVWGVCFFVATSAMGNETFRLWPDKAPGETVAAPSRDNQGKGGVLRLIEVTTPEVTICPPPEKKSDICVLLFPGGGYMNNNQSHQQRFVPFFHERGITVAYLNYRVPRRPGQKIWKAPFQDAQRAIRIVRSQAAKYGFDPEKIGTMGFSAGGHLSILCATNSQTNAYDAIDSLDQVPCHLNFAIAIYPAYILEDGAESSNTQKGNDSALLDDFHFDSRTPPMILVHGDADIYSPMGSVAIYAQLHQRNIPAEIHIYAKSGHGLGSQPWQQCVYEWMKVTLP